MTKEIELKEPRPGSRDDLLIEIEELSLLLDEAEAVARSVRSEMRRTSEHLYSVQCRSNNRQVARLASLASCRAMMTFAAKAAPMIVEGASRDELVALVNECEALRFQEERELKQTFLAELNAALDEFIE